MVLLQLNVGKPERERERRERGGREIGREKGERERETERRVGGSMKEIFPKY